MPVFTDQTQSAASVDVVGGTFGNGNSLTPDAPGGSSWVDTLGTDTQNPPNNAGPAGISTTIAGLSAGTYTVSFDFLQNNGAKELVNLGSTDFSNTSTPVSGTSIRGTQSTWVNASATFTVGSGTNYLSFYSVQGIGANSSQQTAGVTNIVVSQVVPEPLPTAIAGAAAIFGFLALKRRTA